MSWSTSNSVGSLRQAFCMWMICTCTTTCEFEHSVDAGEEGRNLLSGSVNNRASFLWKGYHLEFSMGSVRFGLLVLYLLIVSHALVVVAAVGLNQWTEMSGVYHQCAMGFSAVLFGLKVVLNHGSPTFTRIHGFQVPTKYAAWLELVVIHVLVPRSSFLGHMCGIVAGYCYLLTPENDAIATIVKRLLNVVMLAFTPPPIDPVNTSSTSNRSSPRRRSTEEDELLARRLQEEEFQRAEQTGAVDRDELRRRRAAFFEHS